MSFFQLYTAMFGTLTGMLQRSVHLSFAIILCFLFFPVSKNSKIKTIPIYDLIFAMVGGWAAIYITIFYADLVQRTGDPTMLDLLMGIVTVLCILEGARRAVGLPLALIGAFFILYAFVGPYLPDTLAHRGYSVRRVVDHLYLTMEGVFGVPLWVSSTFVFAFVLFGAILEKNGSNGLLHEIGLRSCRAYSRRPSQGIGSFKRLHGKHFRKRDRQCGDYRFHNHSFNEKTWV